MCREAARQTFVRSRSVLSTVLSTHPSIHRFVWFAFLVYVYLDFWFVCCVRLFILHYVAFAFISTTSSFARSFGFVVLLFFLRWFAFARVCIGFWFSFFIPFVRWFLRSFFLSLRFASFSFMVLLRSFLCLPLLSTTYYVLVTYLWFTKTKQTETGKRQA